VHKLDLSFDEPVYPEYFGHGRLMDYEDVTREIAAVKDTVQSITLNGQSELEAVPEILKNCPRLEELDICFTAIKAHPDFLFEMDTLRSLRIEFNVQDHIPEKLFSLKNLEKLFIHGNEKITRLPDTIGSVKLKELYIHSTGITTLPSPMANLSKLKKLDIGSYSYDNILFLDLAQWIEILSHCRVLTEFNLLGSYDIGNTHEQLYRLSALQKIYLNDIKSTGSPMCSLYKMENLRSITISGGGIKELDPNIGKLVNLKELRLHGNMLETLPESLFEMPGLKKIDFSQNNLNEDCLKKLEALKKRRKGDKKKNPLTIYTGGQGFHWAIKLLKDANKTIASGAVIDSALYMELCVNAVKVTGYALKYIHPENLKMDDYFTICMAAVEDVGDSIEYIHDEFLSAGQYAALCLKGAAINNRANFLEMVNHKRLNREVYLEICRISVEHHPVTLRHMADHTPELCRLAVEKEAWAIVCVPEHLKTAELCRSAVQRNNILIKYVPERLKTEVLNPPKEV